MKTNKKSLVLHGVAALVLVPLVIGMGLLIADSVTEIMQKRRLANGVQIMATVTDRENQFDLVRGGGSASYEIDYEFQYTDRQTGQLKKQIHTGYPVYEKEYGAYTPGSTFTATFIPGEPAVNGPAAAVGRLSPQTVLLSRVLAGLLLIGLVFGLLVPKLSRAFDRLEGAWRMLTISITALVSLVVGSVIGGNVAHLIERILL